MEIGQALRELEIKLAGVREHKENTSQRVATLKHMGARAEHIAQLTGSNVLPVSKLRAMIWEVECAREKSRDD